MTTSASTVTHNTSRSISRIVDGALKYSAQFWYFAAVIGQLIFAYYVAVLYGGAAARGDFAAWGTVMPRGYIPGDLVGNIVIGLHLLLAVVITIGGLLQLVPQIRMRVPQVHRCNGRVYLTAAILMSLGGLYLLWVRGTVGDTSQHLGTTLNAILILFFATQAWRYAVARDIATHRRWALRLFLAVSGVWFFRVGLMLWLVIHQAPVGFDEKTFQGPFLTFLTFAQTLLPLAVLELYFRAQRESSSVVQRIGIVALLVTLSIAMGVGIFGATMGMWAPRL